MKENDALGVPGAEPPVGLSATSPQPSASGLSAPIPHAGRGFFGVGIWHPKTSHNIGTLWRSANLFGAAFMFTVGSRVRPQASDTLKSDRHIPLFHFTDIVDLKEHLPKGCPLVGVELCEGAVPSHHFNHRQQVCYLLGAEDHGLSPEVLAMCHATLVLPGRHSLNVSVAGSLVLYDRWLQTQRSLTPNS